MPHGRGHIPTAQADGGSNAGYMWGYLCNCPIIDSEPLNERTDDEGTGLHALRSQTPLIAFACLGRQPLLRNSHALCNN
jgi:hypothetical protein